ncbi:DUF736 family protein [Geoglobus acetivorans]|uniref:Uncharacterized protein n=1 Tax=Geoglobus acetivorans TaxID=565033 RepID=A0A0A7GHJ1_GEOAI|nr:hypothetical protein GACE_1376 [Geoglobus acetivorans]
MPQHKQNAGKKYLAGMVDFGILGRREAYLFKNEKREKDTQPAFRLVIREGDTWKEVGAFWVREVKQKEPEEEVFDMTG